MGSGDLYLDIFFYNDYHLHVERLVLSFPMVLMSVLFFFRSGFIFSF